MTVKLCLVAGQPCQVKYFTRSGQYTTYNYTTYYEQIEGFAPANTIPIFNLESGLAYPCVEIVGVSGTSYKGYGLTAIGGQYIGARTAPPSFSELWSLFPGSYDSDPLNGQYYTNWGYWTDAHTGDAVRFVYPFVSKLITITFNANGGSVKPTSMKTTSASIISWYTDGGTITDFPVPTKSGLKFLGWYSAAVGGTLVVANSRMISPNNHTLFAHWLATIRLNANGGTVNPQTISVEVGATYGTLPMPVRSNYDFLGWFTATTGGTQILPETIVPVAPPSVLYAHWQKIVCVIVFDAQGGESFDSQGEYWYFKRITYGSIYGDLPIARMEGSVFDGWFTAATGGTRISSSDVFSRHEDQTLYAHWTSPTQCATVYFNGNGGTVGTSQRSVVVGSPIGTLPSATRSGYALAGWKDGNGAVVTAATVMPPRNIWVYAQWNGNNCTLTFNANGGTVTPATKSCTVGAIAGTLPKPTRADYSFLGWFTAATGGNEFTDATVMTGNKTVYAHWQAGIDWWIIDIS